MQEDTVFYIIGGVNRSETMTGYMPIKLLSYFCPYCMNILVETYSLNHIPRYFIRKK